MTEPVAEAWELRRARPLRGGRLPRARVHQPGSVARRCEPGLLRRHRGRGGRDRRVREQRRLAEDAGRVRQRRGDVQAMMGRPLLPARPDAPPLRSVLFVPGSDERRLRSAPDTGADALILDLEEPQTPMTEAVREQRARRSPRSSTRNHRLTPPAARCCSAACNRRARADVGGPHGVYASRAHRHRAAQVIRRSRSRRRGRRARQRRGAHRPAAIGSTWIYPIFETAESIRSAYDIAVASPHVAYMGGADLAVR